MSINFRELAKEYLGNDLIESYGFRELKKIEDDLSEFAEYSSEHFVVKLVTYRREIYVTLYKAGNPDEEINLFNLLNYLNQKNSTTVESEYFPSETNLEECYRKQLKHIAYTVESHFKEIYDFFTCENIELEYSALEKYMLMTYPNLFSRGSTTDDVDDV